MISREMVSQPLSDALITSVSSLGAKRPTSSSCSTMSSCRKNGLFNLGDPTAMSYYGPVCVFARHVLVRLAVKAELFVGAGQMVLDYLGTGRIPAVQMMLSQLDRICADAACFRDRGRGLGLAHRG